MIGFLLASPLPATVALGSPAEFRQPPRLEQDVAVAIYSCLLARCAHDALGSFVEEMIEMPKLGSR